MKKNNILYMLLFALTSIFANCKKNNTPPLTELEKLPPITQTGANTFGCLVNGKAWVAQRNDCSILCDPSFKILYDGGNGGNLTITGLYIDQSKSINQALIIGLDSTNFKNQFIFSPITSLNIGFTFVNNSQYTRSWDATVSSTGTVNLTKYDLANGIISGNFQFTLSKPGIETISVTNGRFDKKL